MNNKKPTFYKNDLKFYDKTDDTEIEDDLTKELYNKFRNKPKIELRIDECIRENYTYFDLSHMKLDDEIINNLFKVQNIKQILSKIYFLDLSNNKLTKIPEINKYTNIKCINISHNNIDGEIINNNWIEISCENNKITNIISNSVERLVASNNKINKINTPNATSIIINDNEITDLDSYNNLEYCEIMGNKLKKINDYENLTELYISNNYVSELGNLNNIKILNCVKNKLEKIPYYSTMHAIVSTTPLISKKYQVENISIMNNDYVISIKI